MFITKQTKEINKVLTDKIIIDKILNHGASQYQEVLYDRYADKIYYKCLSILKEVNLAKDLTHDTMIKVFCKLATYKGNSDFSFWVNAIAYNTCMSYLRNKKKERFVEMDTVYDMEKAANEKEIRVLHELKLEQLEKCFELLPAEDKLILLMHYRDNMTTQKIANSLNIGQSAAKMRLLRSRKRLVKLMSRLDEKEPVFIRKTDRIFNLQESFEYFTPENRLKLARA